MRESRSPTPSNWARSYMVTPAQIRKDLSYFGRFGKQGRGYRVRHLLAELKQILGLDAEWNVAVIGVGRLGNAILNYPGFNPDGFHLVAAFDNNPDNVGQEVGGISIQPMSDLAETVAVRDIAIAIVAVPKRSPPKRWWTNWCIAASRRS